MSYKELLIIRFPYKTNYGFPAIQNYKFKKIAINYYKNNKRTININHYSHSSFFS